MELSTADAEKWLPLLEQILHPTPVKKRDLERGVVTGARPQRRITDAEARDLVQRYQAGESTRQLATSMGWSRNTITHQLKAAGVMIRELQSPNPEQIDEMVRLYKSGLSMARVGERVGFSAKSVMKYLLERGVTTRDTHGQERQSEF